MKFYEDNFDGTLKDSDGIEWECELSVYVECSSDPDFGYELIIIEGNISNGTEIQKIAIGTKNENEDGYDVLDDKMTEYLIEWVTGNAD